MANKKVYDSVLLNEIKSLHKSGISLTKIGTSIGYTGATISLYVNEKYRGDVPKIEHALKAYLKNIQLRKNLKQYKPVFCDLQNSRQVFASCKMAHVDKVMNVIISDSGLGKTEALKEYTKRYPTSILVEVDATYTTKRLFSVIHQKLGRSGRGVLGDIYSDCVDSLKKTDILLIIDEAEYLPKKALELIRRVYDKAEIGIVLSGMPILLQNIRGLHSEYRQIFTRIAASMKLSPFNKEDVKKIACVQLGLRPFENVNDKTIIETLYSECRRNGRTLSMLIFQCIRISESQSVDISPELIKQAATMLEV